MPKLKCQIVSFMHCGKCLDELPPDTSPRDYAQLEMGFTKPGFQIWCKRHDCNVANFDLLGNKIKAIKG